MKTLFLFSTIVLLSVACFGQQPVTIIKAPSDAFEQSWKMKIPDCSSVAAWQNGGVEGEPLIISDILFYPGSSCTAIDIKEDRMLSFNNPADLEKINRAILTDSLLRISSDDYVRILNLRSGKTIFFKERRLYTHAFFTPQLQRMRDIVWASDSNELSCYDLQKKVLLWTKRFERYVSDITFVQNNLFFASDSKFIYALDRKTGQEIWRAETGGVFYSNGLLLENTLLVQIENVGLTAIDLKTHKIKWSFSDGYANVFVNVLQDQGRVLLQSNKLSSIDMETGNLIWSNPLSGHSTTLNWIAQTPKHLILYSKVDDDSYVSIYDKASGKERFDLWNGWLDWIDRNPPIYFGRHFLYSNPDQTLYGYDNELQNGNVVHRIYAYKIKIH
jgi:outer membrane protein assembly factor BamB